MDDETVTLVLTSEEHDTLAKLVEDAVDGELRSYKVRVLDALHAKLATGPEGGSDESA